MIDFRSDNTHGASPEILEAIARANTDTITSYGGDAITARLQKRIAELFEHDVAIFPVLTGTAGNALTLGAMAGANDTIVCHEDAHIIRDELGAPELFTGGAKLLPLAGANGKLHDVPDTRVLSLTNATEAGTVYTPDELRALCDRAERVHLDGARFANAVASLGASPADLTWRAGVDVLVLGATKNGALGAEVIIAFDKTLEETLAPLWHRSGHRVSKMRFLSAQLEAYLTDDLWLRNARHANAMAQRLARGLGASLIHPVEANVVFTRLAKPVDGFLYYDWPIFGDDAYRLVTAFDTREEDVDAFLAAVHA
ncbi:MAG TPA: beta-eliminating lyase-related protein [Thermoanaerobaculia bacterium]|nr:beta-eliminating lyase-related protein [Thermoanaerobaculia bacterium]